MSLGMLGTAANFFMSAPSKTNVEMASERFGARQALSRVIDQSDRSSATLLERELSSIRLMKPDVYDQIRDDTLVFEGATLFHLVAEKGSADAMSVLLRHFPDKVNVKDEQGRTPLHAAARGNNSDVIEFLLGKNADADAKDCNGWTALIWAAFSNATNAIKALLGYSSVHLTCNIDELNDSNETPFLIAIKSGSIEAADFLLKAGAAADAVESSGRNALMWAARLEDPDKCQAAVDLLRPSTGEFQMYDREQKNALGIAIAEGTVKNMEVLLTAGANPNSAGESRTAFAAAISRIYKSDRQEKINVIMNHEQFDPDIRGFDGLTAVLEAVEIAMFHEHQRPDLQTIETIETLVKEKGADPTIGNNRGDTMRHFLQSDRSPLRVDIANKLNALIDDYERKHA